MFSVFLRVNVYLAMFLTIPFNMFYYIALKYGSFLLETLDTSLVEGCIHTFQKSIGRG